jgi:hypothetical protein
MTIYRYEGPAFSTVGIEIEYQGNDHWWPVGKDFTNEHYKWEAYQNAVVRDERDPTGGEGKIFPAAYFIDPEARHLVTKSWLRDQVNAQQVIS